MTNQRRRVVVVGAGSGIGAATAAHFHQHGDFDGGFINAITAGTPVPQGQARGN